MSFEFRPMRSLIFVDCVREEYRHRLQHWLYNTHIPDSISKFTPYCVKYAFYNALPVPPGGERFGTRRMQMTEHYWLINEMLPEMRNNAFGEVMPPEVLRWQGMLPDSDDEKLLGALADEMRSLYERAKADDPEIACLSLGMSGDYKLCIEHGSNMIRVGSTIFGARKYM